MERYFALLCHPDPVRRMLRPKELARWLHDSRSISEPSLDLHRLLRTAVARFGEMELAHARNTAGQRGAPQPWREHGR